MSSDDNYEQEIKKYRNEIDDIDNKIAKLINERLKKVKSIAELKKKFNIEIEDKERENMIYKKISKILEVDEKTAEEIYKSIINYCKKFEEKIIENKN